MTFPIRKASAKTTVKPAKSAGSGKSTASQAEDALALHLRAEGIEAIREYRFGAEACGGAGKGLRDRLAKAGLQDWRADFALPEHGLLIECEGGGWAGGRHTRGAGFAADLKKYDAAARLGWRVYRCDPAMIKSGRAIETIRILMQQGESA
jgi:hypothetical protein